MIVAVAILAVIVVIAVIRIAWNREGGLQKLSYIGQFIGGVFAPIAVAVAGFALWESWKQTAESGKQTAIADMSAWTFEMDKVFIEHHELRKYFEGKQPISADNPDYNRVVGIAELSMDVMDSMLYSPYFPPNDSWRKWMHDDFAESPILREHLFDRARWYWKLYPEFKSYPEFEEWKREYTKKTGKVPD